jgi:hypothetical protein
VKTAGTLGLQATRSSISRHDQGSALAGKPPSPRSPVVRSGWTRRTDMAGQLRCCPKRPPDKVRDVS